MPVIQLTDDFIRNLDVAPGQKRTEWCDSVVPGLYIEARVTSPGEGTYYVRYKNTAKKTQHKRLGKTVDLMLGRARQLALQFKAELTQSRESPNTNPAIPTLREFVEKHYVPEASLRKRSFKDDHYRLEQKLLPLWGDRKLNEIKRAEVIQFHLDLRTQGLSGSTADHFVKLLRRILNMAVEFEIIDDNQLDKFKLFNEPNQVENTLNEEELTRLMTVLHTYKNQRLCRIARFLLATGARLGEALNADWANIDVEKRIWLIPAPHSKSKRITSKPLNDAAIQVLSEVNPDTATRNGYVFVNPNTGKPFTSIHKGWKAIREAAELSHLRIHDLRHQYASMLVNSGRSLYEVQQILGHSSPTISQRYAHLSPATLQDAANAASAQLEAATPKLLPAPADTPDEAA